MMLKLLYNFFGDPIMTHLIEWGGCGRFECILYLESKLIETKNLHIEIRRLEEVNLKQRHLSTSKERLKLFSLDWNIKILIICYN